jgi:hypothetical protein
MKKTAIALTLLLLASLPCLCSAQTDNTFYAKQFPGVTVGQKVAAAQASCNSNTTIPCIIVIDPSLAVWQVGTMPAQCAQCSWDDYRKVPFSFDGLSLMKCAGDPTSVCLGNDAGTSFMIGTNNTIVGYNAMGNSANFAARNVAVGYLALAGLGNGVENVAIGDNAAVQMQGSDSVMIGAAAADNGPLSLQGSIYLGAYADPGTGSGGQNEIVIGGYATGNGNNTVTLGNSNTTSLYLGSMKIATVGSGAGATCGANGCYRMNSDGSFEEWGQTTTFGGANGGSFTLNFPHAFTDLSSITAIFGPANCDGGSPSYCAGNPGGSPNNVFNCFIETPSLSAPTVVFSSSNTVTAGASCYFHVNGK